MGSTKDRPPTHAHIHPHIHPPTNPHTHTHTQSEIPDAREMGYMLIYEMSETIDQSLKEQLPSLTQVCVGGYVCVCVCVCDERDD